MPGLMTPSMTIGGTPLYPQAPYVNPRLPVYKPQIQRSGLLNDTKANDLVRNFAGGLLNGYQYNPNAGAGQAQIAPTTPSGVYTADPNQGVNTTPTGGGNLTFRDAIEMRYGPGDLYGGDQDVFLGNLMGLGGNTAMADQVAGAWGASLDDPYSRDSDFWRYLQEHLGKMGGNIWQGRGEGGNAGSPGPDAGQGGSDV